MFNIHTLSKTYGGIIEGYPACISGKGLYVIGRVSVGKSERDGPVVLSSECVSAFVCPVPVKIAGGYRRSCCCRQGCRQGCSQMREAEAENKDED